MSEPRHYGFIVNTAGVTISLDFTDAVSEAYDIMAADKVPPDTAAKLAMEAEKTGRDPVEFARHFVSVRGRAVHNIHWAVIFSNGAITLAFLTLAVTFAVTARRSKGTPVKIGAGDKVTVTLAASAETYIGVVEGVTTPSPGKFTIICTRTGA